MMTHPESTRGIRLASLLLPFSLFNLNSNLLLGRRGDLSKSVRSACVLRRRQVPVNVFDDHQLTDFSNFL